MMYKEGGAIIVYLFMAVLCFAISMYYLKNPGVDLASVMGGIPKNKVSMKKLKMPADESKTRLYLLLFGGLFSILLVLLAKNPVFFAIAPIPYLAYRFKLRKEASERVKTLQKSLLSAIELLWVPCDAGMGFRDAVKRLSARTDNPIILELNKCYDEIAAGKRREVAYRDLIKRSIPEVESLIRAISYNESMGEPISDFLRRESERLYMEKRAKIQEIGDKISSRIMFVVMGLMGPAFILLIFGPIISRVNWIGSIRNF